MADNAAGGEALLFVRDFLRRIWSIRNALLVKRDAHLANCASLTLTLTQP